MTDPLLQMLDDLHAARIDPSRGQRIRARCHAALLRERRRVPRPARQGRRWPPVIAGLGGLYLTEVVHQVLAIYGVL
jgi:hypothetical protein